MTGVQTCALPISLNRIVPINPKYFFQQLNQDKLPTPMVEHTYFDLWQELNQSFDSKINSFFEIENPFNEFIACHKILNAIPTNSIVHLSNSMPVRYVNLLSLDSKKSIEVYSNRGTSGIDGVMSTAFGAAISTDKLVFVVIGDMAFFYDRNAFWNNYMPNNLRIIVLNNHGGGIFRMLDGPSKQAELEEYFETKQPLKAASLAHEFDLEYFFADTEVYLTSFLNRFVSTIGGSKILEIETSTRTNREVFYQFKNFTS